MGQNDRQSVKNLRFIQDFMNDRRVVATREWKRFSVIKFIGEIRRIRTNM